MVDKIQIKPCDVDSNFAQSMTTWLEAKVKDLNSADIYLLSFHDDGVVWGKIKDDALITSDKNLPNTPSPEFRFETLQELRLFGENGQLHIWRIGEKTFKASLALDGNEGDYKCLKNEEQVLYGNYFVSENPSFTIVRDGEQGLHHAFPQSIAENKFDGKKRPLRLNVKHYIENDDDGCARIAFSRLVNIGVEGE